MIGDREIAIQGAETAEDLMRAARLAVQYVEDGGLGNPGFAIYGGSNLSPAPEVVVRHTKTRIVCEFVRRRS